MHQWWASLLGIASALSASWVVLVIVLWSLRPDELSVRDALRLLPDVVRLIRRLARDTSLPRGVRVRLWLLVGYLVLPFDLIPDFIPVLGYADDAIIAVLTLRSVTRLAGPTAIERHWPGTPDGLAALLRLTRLDP